MKRNIVKIDEEKCIGCGLCTQACSQGAIGLVDGKAKLLREDYCDGLGVCLPSCPVDAITIEEREVAGFVEKSKRETLKAEAKVDTKAEARANTVAETKVTNSGCSCVGLRSEEIKRGSPSISVNQPSDVSSKLRQWPVQIKLAPITAPYYSNANLLIAADCTAYAYGDFHNQFMKNKITLIGCPKLDEGDYSEKLTAIIKNNDIKSVTIVRMEVPCCNGLANSAKKALQDSGKFIPWQIVTISTNGEIKD